MHGDCLLRRRPEPAAGMTKNVTRMSTEAGNSTWSGSRIADHRAAGDAWAPPKVCSCAEGFAGGRCSYVSFSEMRAGGAACNATASCGGGNGSSCVHERCVCGPAWTGARCSYPNGHLHGIGVPKGGGRCTTSQDCSGEATGNICQFGNTSRMSGGGGNGGGNRSTLGGSSSSSSKVRQGAALDSSARESTRGSGVAGRCVCGPFQRGLHCELQAFGTLAAGGGECNTSVECNAHSLPFRPHASQKSTSTAPSSPSTMGSIPRMSENGTGGTYRMARHTDRHTDITRQPEEYPEGTCVKAQCVCAAGRLGAHCSFSIDLLMRLASSHRHEKREQLRAQGLHLCLSAWRGGSNGGSNGGSSSGGSSGGTSGGSSAGEQDEAGSEQDAEQATLTDGTPLSFALCRRRQNTHQQYALVAEPRRGGVADGAKEAGQDRGRPQAFRIRAEGAPHLCVTVPPVNLE